MSITHPVGRADAAPLFTYSLAPYAALTCHLTAAQLAARLNLPPSWVLDNANPQLCADPIPHLALGRYKRFAWNSPQLQAWIERHVVASAIHRPASATELTPDCEYLDAAELAARLNVPASWVRDQVRSRSANSIPHVRFGKYLRFRWGSPELDCWAEGRMLGGHNTGVNRAPRKETIQ